MGGIIEKIKTQPAFVLAALNAAIMIVGTVGADWFNGEQAGLLVILINAVAAAITAFVTRPVAPSAFTALISAALAFAGAYGFNLSGETVAAINAAVYPFLAFLTWGNVSPIPTAVTDTTKAPVPQAFEKTSVTE